MSEIETEIKLPIKDMVETLRRLRGIATYSHTEYVRDVIYGAEGKKKIRLRYRDALNQLLVEATRKYKVPSEDGTKKEVEEEIYSGRSPEDAIFAIQSQGYREENSYEKIRIVYLKGASVIVTVDIYPFGSWLEIEGKTEDIWPVAEYLGYGKEEVCTQNADECYLEWTKKAGLPELWDVRFGLGQ